MTTRPTFTDINNANAEIRDMEHHMHIMKRMIAVQSERIENFQELIKVLNNRIEASKSLHDSRIRLIEAWIIMLQDNRVGMVMDSMDRIVGSYKSKETI